MRRIVQWFDDRLKFTALIDFLSHKTVPTHHHSIWYYFGGVSLLLFGIQVFTGMLLLFYYRPGTETAFESIQFIMSRVPFGWLIRSVHSWGANLMVLAAFVHMFSVFFMKAYRPPNELTWMSGFMLLGLAMFFGFSGYLLPWNELAFFATKVGTDIVGAVPGVGHWILVLLRGGEDVSGTTIGRFFGIHIALLPLFTMAVLFLHLGLIQRQGISNPISKANEPSPAIPFYPNFMIRETMVWLGVIGVLITLSTFLPWELGLKADPFKPAPAGIHPEWYFTFMSQTLKYLPPSILGFEGEQVGILAFGFAGLLFFLTPLLDWQAKRGQSSRLFTAAGVLAIAYLAVLTALAYLRPY